MTAADASSPARLAGPAGAVFTTAAVLLATVLSPTFTWTGSALSDLGVDADPIVVLLFNGGLVAGGLIGAVYAYALWSHSIPITVTYLLSLGAMTLVGVFPSGTDLHFPVAVAFFLLATITVTLDGWRQRASPVGKLAFALAAVHLLGWVGWSYGIRPGDGLALPELGGVVMFGVWLFALAPSSQWWWR